jgi:hypothetical protein
MPAAKQCGEQQLSAALCCLVQALRVVPLLQSVLQATLRLKVDALDNRKTLSWQAAAGWQIMCLQNLSADVQQFGSAGCRPTQLRHALPLQ